MLFCLPSLAMAQFSDSYTFLKAVRDRDGAKVTELIDKPGSTIVNTRDISTGETALMIATRARDLTWMNFLLGKGANPNLADRQGITPLMTATQLRFPEGAQLLLEQKAQVDRAANGGETALIRAVHLRDTAMVQILISHGANPDKRDLTGLSARDYAERDARGTALATIIEAIKPTRTPSGPPQSPTC